MKWGIILLNELKICCMSNEETLKFAADELRRYSTIMQKNLSVSHLSDCQGSCPKDNTKFTLMFQMGKALYQESIREVFFLEFIVSLQKQAVCG